MTWMYVQDVTFYGFLGLIAVMPIGLLLAAYQHISLQSALQSARKILDQWARFAPNNAVKKLVRVGGLSGTLVILGFVAYELNRTGDAVLPYLSRSVGHLGNREVIWALGHPRDFRVVTYEFRKIADLSDRIKWEAEKGKLGVYDVRASRVLFFLFVMVLLAAIVDMGSKSYRERGVALLVIGIVGIGTSFVVWTEREGRYIDNVVSKYEELLAKRQKKAELPASYMRIVGGDEGR